jgi:hypothetical protein
MGNRKSKDNAKDGALIPAASESGIIDEAVLFERVAAIIERRKNNAAAYANSEGTLMFWEVGQYINSVILDFKRAEYGKKIFSTLAIKLVARYGKSFSEQNLYRMTQFAEKFSDFEILSPLTTKLSWSHFCELIRVKTGEARMYYAEDASARGYGVKELRRRISRKGYERREIIELLEPDKTGIAAAEYWTHLPPKAEFERKIREILTEARERLERRKLLTDSGLQRQIDYFIEPKDDEDE